jgi:hypothetical protein
MEAERGEWFGGREKVSVMDGVEVALYFAMWVSAITFIAGLWALLRWR